MRASQALASRAASHPALHGMGSRTAGYATRYGSSARHGAHVAGFADNRWNKYNGGNGLEPEVWLINVNDGLLGVVVAAALFHHFRSTGPLDRWSHASKPVVLLTLLRDATLLRETIEYVDSHASVARCSISRVTVRHRSCLTLAGTCGTITARTTRTPQQILRCDLMELLFFG